MKPTSHFSGTMNYKEWAWENIFWKEEEQEETQDEEYLDDEWRDT